ncbi:unnamed protein product [Rhizophagus irregularis]|nr:unnamed protein product [Rhizophagus irregularis]
MKRNFLILKPKLPILQPTSIPSTHNKDKPAKTPKRIAPYDKTSYEQTKKKHFTRSSSKPSSSKNSADDSDNFPQTEDDAIMQQHLENLRTMLLMMAL